MSHATGPLPLLATVRDPVAVVQDGTLCYANESFADLTGAPNAEGRPVGELAPRDAAPDVEGFCDAVQRGDAPRTTAKLVLSDGDGGRLTAAVEAARVEHDGDPAAGLVVDERETRLRDAPAAGQYERLVEALPLGVYRVVDGDGGGELALVNDGLVSLFDADSRADLVGRPAADLFADPADYEALVDRLTESGGVAGAEVELETLSGETRWGSVTAVTEETEAGRRFDGVVRDITRRREMERDLRRSAERFRRMFERHSAPMLLVDPETGGIQNANEAASEFYGYSRQELTGLCVHDLNVLPEAEVARRRRAAREEDRNQFQFRHELADGDVRTVEVHSSPIEFEDDELLFSVVHDVTDRVNYEDRLETQRDNLDVLNQVLRHDIRNDLQLVFAYAEMLVDEVGDEEREYAERILESADHAVELTETARDIADVMLATDRQRKPVSLRSVLDDEVNEVRGSYPGAAITVDGAVPDVDVAGTEMLDSVFRNLLKNAVQHNDRPVAEVSVSVTEREETVTVRVADNGPGVPDAQKDDIFGKGEKGLESEGSGIGLYLVQTLVDGVGGDVWVEDNDPRGAVFVVELQRA